MNLPLPLIARNSFSALAAVLTAATVLSAQAQPELVSIVPDRFAIAVSPGAQVVFIFSVPMNTNTTTAWFTNFADSGPVFVPTTSAWRDDDTVLTCTPNPIFPRKQTIGWTVRGEDRTGAPLETDTGVFATSSGGGTNRVTTFKVGKLFYYGQTSADAPTLNPHRGFNATITLASNRTATAASLTLPTTTVVDLSVSLMEPELFEFSDYSTPPTSFETTYPDGGYLFEVREASSNQQVTVHFPLGLLQPDAPHLANFAAAQAINATQPFTLTWDSFPGGTAADNVTVEVWDVFRTPAPGTPGALPGTATSVVIPANTLQPGSNYTAYLVFHRLLVDTSHPTYATSACRATETGFPLRTVPGTTAPLLAVARTAANTVVVSWPAPAEEWLLEGTNAVPSVTAASWPLVPQPYQTNGGTISVTFTNSPAIGNQFFRLHRP